MLGFPEDRERLWPGQEAVVLRKNEFGRCVFCDSERPRDRERDRLLSLLDRDTGGCGTAIPGHVLGQQLIQIAPAMFIDDSIELIENSVIIVRIGQSNSILEFRVEI